MNDKDIYKSMIKTSAAADRYISNRNRTGKLETQIVWWRVALAVGGLAGFVALLIWLRVWGIVLIALPVVGGGAAILIDRFVQSRRLKRRLRNNDLVPTLRITDTRELSRASKMDTRDLRRVFKLEETSEREVMMKDLKKGDKFRLVTDDPADCLFGKDTVVYEAAKDARLMGRAFGVDVVTEKEPKGL